MALSSVNKKKMDQSKCVCIDHQYEIDKLNIKLRIAHEMLRSKDETLQIMEESLAHSKNQVKELQLCLRAAEKYKNDKAAEVMNLEKCCSLYLKQVDDIQKEKEDFCHEILELKNQKYDLDTLKFEFSVIEDLYKITNDELIKQGQIMNSLRQASLDKDEEIYNLNIDVDILKSKLKFYNERENKKFLSQVEVDLHEMSVELNNLKDILIIEENVCENKSELCPMEKDCNQKPVSKPHNKNRPKVNKNKKFKINLERTRARLSYIKGELKIKTMLLLNLKNETNNYKKQAFSKNKQVDKMKQQIDILENEILRQKQKIDSLNHEMKNLNSDNQEKSESIRWLETQLSESSTKGKEMCDMSLIVFERLRELTALKARS